MHLVAALAAMTNVETKCKRLYLPLRADMRGALARLYDWLDCGDEFSDSDFVFVHAGAKQRKVIALGLYSQGKSEACC